MEIERIRLFPYSIRRESPFRIATMVSQSVDGVFVSVESGGLTGWGEAMPFHAINGETQGTCLEALKFLAPHITGRKLGGPGTEANRLKSLLPTQTTALCALDMAMHDLAAQALGIPLWQLLGGEPRRLPTDLTIGIVDPDTALSKAEAIASAGFRAVKVKLGDGLESDIGRVAAVREGAPESAIRVDANQAYDRETALELLSEIAELGIEFCEQPVRRGDWAGLKWLHDHAPVPVMADESCFSAEDAFSLLRDGCCNLVNVKLCKTAGIAGALEVASVVRNGFGRCMVGGMAETRLGVTASAHVGCSDPAFTFFDLDAHVGHAEDPIDGGIRIEEGEVVLPNGAGLGARPKDGFLSTLNPTEAR